jgi:dTDP-4-amino-4,6-dideoxygalactose transaminase
MRDAMPIPLVDLKAQLRQIEDEVRRGWDRVLENTAFILGAEVAGFESELAAFVGTAHCVGVASGTDAVELAVRAAGIGPGDEVILPANTFIATALGVSRAGATPVLVDQDPDYHLVDVAQVESKITDRTRALMPVHLYGQCADMDAIAALAKKHDLVVLEDAAQAQGAKQDGRSAGTFGLAAGTSFYPGKNLGAFGDAGAIVTDSEALAAKVRALRNYGSDVKYHHPETGFNSRLDALQAVVLRAKLPHLAGWNARRRDAAARYDELLAGVDEVVRPRTRPGNEHIWHLYVVEVDRRDAVLKHLNERGIGAGIHYPVPIHLQGAYAHLGHREGDFPVAEQKAKRILSLPLFPEITAEQQTEVVAALRDAVTS